MANKAVTAIGIGGFGVILLWSGITNTGLLMTIRSLIQGTQPVPGAPQASGRQPGATGTPSAYTFGPSAGGGNSAIAQEALTLDGMPYVWGGTEPPPAYGGNGHGMDCYGLLNWVLRKLGYNLYPGNAHPGYLEYLAWGGATKVSSPQAGDLIIWPTHSGIAISPTQMISAENPQAGTRVDTFAGGGPTLPEPMTILRVNNPALVA